MAEVKAVHVEVFEAQVVSSVGFGARARPHNVTY